jgi:hypothetical protein
MVESSDISALKPDGSRLGKITTTGAVRCLFFDDQGALWATMDDGMAKYQIRQK